MKKLKFIAAFLAVAFLFSSCAEDDDPTVSLPAESNLPGTWNTSDGGTITFNADATGSTMNSAFFAFDCGTLNGSLIGPVEEFTWTITSEGENLRMAFSDSTSFVAACSGSMEVPVNVSSSTSATVGSSAFGFGSVVQLTR